MGGQHAGIVRLHFEWSKTSEPRQRQSDHVIGLADAPVTVVNHGDDECPDCDHRHCEVEKLVDELSDQMRLSIPPRHDLGNIRRTDDLY